MFVGWVAQHASGWGTLALIHDRYDIFTMPQPPSAKLLEKQWQILQTIIRWVEPTYETCPGLSRLSFKMSGVEPRKWVELGPSLRFCVFFFGWPMAQAVPGEDPCSPGVAGHPFPWKVQGRGESVSTKRAESRECGPAFDRGVPECGTFRPRFECCRHQVCQRCITPAFHVQFGADVAGRERTCQREPTEHCWRASSGMGWKRWGFISSFCWASWAETPLLKSVFFNRQHLCYAPNSFGMIVGNLIFGDHYSTLWPSTMLRCSI